MKTYLYRACIVLCSVYFLFMIGHNFYYGEHFLITWISVVGVILFAIGAVLKIISDRRLKRTASGELREFSETQLEELRMLKATGQMTEAVKKARIWYPGLGLIAAKKLVDSI
ncbi:hypothetical protein LJU02_04605 [Corynebacterium pseudotuberculosis]|uniref:hypothetical protein n=1 Tax=Corynebacterium pseudotuberculosis TaxID=1719 RepID=UPI00022BC791|nr:hypothetical protein [Corynebacterium pseudotuberculosis]AKS13245.1 Hypothetical protein CpE19_0906 [Corynebacterium pseudotuberculosis]AMN71756.1 hypothetical protein ATN03_04600 [Corynebacterium pseudotuberculosis]AMN75833.1 hypothetical protein ATN05_05735 [Corynebacterium pseudotuberculosis]ANZ91964.1 hypothetical protein CPMB20_05725 [Corynebacterium pseudotuberculosis]APB10818.1 hypothetical protein A4R72_04795 [Corynebacterium pseudotuberculosis]